jgi:hypothetical protein
MRKREIGKRKKRKRDMRKREIGKRKKRKR